MPHHPDVPTRLARHRAVFDLNRQDPEVWDGVLRNMENALQALGPEDTWLELVAYGEGLGMLLKTNQALAGRIHALSERHVVFAACENTMRRRNVSADDLLACVVPVPSGVAELILKQEAGWAYVKAGH